MFKNINHIGYVKDYMHFNAIDFFHSHKKLKINKLCISISSYECLASRKDLDEFTTLDEDDEFHVDVLSLIKVFDPKLCKIEPTMDSVIQNIPVYNCKITVNDKEEIQSLIELFVYEYKFFERLDSKVNFDVSHITERRKKFSIHVPIIDIDDLATYSLTKLKNFEIKKINVVFDFYINL